MHSGLNIQRISDGGLSLKLSTGNTVFYIRERGNKVKPKFIWGKYVSK